MTTRARTGRSLQERLWWGAPAVVFIVASIVATWASGPYLVGVFHDDGIYALLAQSIATGHGFHYSHLVGNPAAIHYPPLYPLLLSVLWRVVPQFPDNLPLLLGLNSVLVGVAAAGYWFFARERDEWHPLSAAIGALACTLALPTLALAGALLSETLFLALLWPTLIASERALAQPAMHKFVCLGVLIGALMLVRTHALALLLAVIVVLAFERRWRDGAIVFGSALAIQLPWIVWTGVATPRVAAPLEGAYGSYLGWFANGVAGGGAPFVLATIQRNASECWLYFQDRFAAGFPVILQLLVFAIAAVALIAGAVRLWPRARTTIVFVVLYLAIVLVWPYNPWRFVWAIWPLVTFLIIAGIHAIYVRGGRWRIAAVSLSLLPLAAALRVELHAYALRDWRSSAAEGAAQITPVLQWAHANVSRDDVLLSEGEPVLALYEELKVEPPASFTAREYLSPPGGAEGAARLAEMMRTVHARYVILFNPGMIQAASLLREQHPGLIPARQFPAGVAFEATP